MYIVEVKNKRPDFRVFIDLLYGYNHNVDTDGDAYPVYSRDWKELFIANREKANSFIEIIANEQSQELFEIKSDEQELEIISALYLYEYCGSNIIKDNKKLSLELINNFKNKFLIELERGRKSIWHKSNSNNPYCNDQEL